MGGGGGKGGSREQTVTQRTEIPAWLRQPMQRAVGAAGALLSQGEPAYFPGETVVPMAQQTRQALGMTEQMAGQPDPYGALSNFQGLMGGDYLYGGPGFNAALDAATRAITPRVQSAFGRAGRQQSGLAQAAVAEELGDVFAGMYGQERGRQMQGLGLLPQMEAMRGLPAQRLAQVGGALEQQRGREIADERARYEAEAYGPQVALDRFISRITGIAPFGGSTQTTSQPLYRNPFAGALGGALSGLGMAGQLGQAMPFFGGVPGAALLGLGGGLLGALG